MRTLTSSDDVIRMLVFKFLESNSSVSHRKGCSLMFHLMTADCVLMMLPGMVIKCLCLEDQGH